MIWLLPVAAQVSTTACGMGVSWTLNRPVTGSRMTKPAPTSNPVSVGSQAPSVKRRTGLTVSRTVSTLGGAHNKAVARNADTWANSERMLGGHPWSDTFWKNCIAGLYPAQVLALGKVENPMNLGCFSLGKATLSHKGIHLGEDLFNPTSLII